MYRIMRRLIYENAEKLKNETKTKKETDIGMAREETSSNQASPWSFYCPKTNAAWIWFIMKYILIPKLASLKKIAAVKKKVFLELTKSLHDKVMEGEVSLHDWYWQNQRHFK